MLFSCHRVVIVIDLPITRPLRHRICMYVLQAYLFYRLPSVPMSMMVKAGMSAAFLLAAFYTGLTRIPDNMHHPGDVLAGFVIGFAIGVYTVSERALWSPYTCGFHSILLTTYQSIPYLTVRSGQWYWLPIDLWGIALINPLCWVWRLILCRPVCIPSHQTTIVIKNRGLCDATVSNTTAILSWLCRPINTTLRASLNVLYID